MTYIAQNLKRSMHVYMHDHVMNSSELGCDRVSTKHAWYVQKTIEIG